MIIQVDDRFCSPIAALVSLIFSYATHYSSCITTLITMADTNEVDASLVIFLPRHNSLDLEVEISFENRLALHCPPHQIFPTQHMQLRIQSCQAHAFYV